MDGWEGVQQHNDCINCDGTEGWATAPDGWGNAPDGWGNGPDEWAHTPDGWGTAPDGWGNTPDPECVTTTLQLNEQLSAERLSFIHSQSSREEDQDYDSFPLPAPPPPPQQVPLPIPPPPKTRESTPMVTPTNPSLVEFRQPSSQNWGSGEESDGERSNTIRQIFNIILFSLKELDKGNIPNRPPSIIHISVLTSEGADRVVNLT